MRGDRRTLPSSVSAADYIKALPALRPYGLVYGALRPPPSTNCPGESALIPRLVTAIAKGAPVGTEVRVPADVVLDQKSLVIHPTLAVVLPRRSAVLRPDGSIWGAPDVVVELAWPAVSRRLRSAKLRWYQRFGVEECWVVNPFRNRIEIVLLARMEGALSGLVPGNVVPLLFSGRNVIASPLLPDVVLGASSLFAGITTRGWSVTTRQRLEQTYEDDEFDLA
jgi:Uma2 family endonuclease